MDRSKQDNEDYDDFKLNLIIEAEERGEGCNLDDWLSDDVRGEGGIYEDNLGYITRPAC